MNISKNFALTSTLSLLCTAPIALAQTPTCLSTVSPTSALTATYPAVTSPLRTTASVSANLQALAFGPDTPCANGSSFLVGYNQPANSNHFCDSFPLPANLDPSQPVILDVTTGATLGNASNDTITIDHMDGSGGFSANRMTAVTGTTANTTYQSVIPPALLAQAFAQAPGAPVLDIHLSDDPAVQSTRLTYCVPPAPAFVYTVKFICGISGEGDVHSEFENVVAAGRYATEINIMNPYAAPVTIRKEVVLLAEVGEKIAREPDQAGVAGGEEFTLNPVHGTIDDCAALARMTGHKPFATQGLTIGFLTILSDIELEVEAVTTTNALTDWRDKTPALVIRHYDPKEIYRFN